MKPNLLYCLLLMIACSAPKSEQSLPVLVTGSQRPMPDEWIDKDTGHKIIRLSRRNQGGRSFYFHNNPFLKQRTDEGDLMVFYGKADTLNQLFTVNLKTLEMVQLTNHPGRIGGEVVDPARREVYFQSSDTVYSVQVDDQSIRQVFVFPPDFKSYISSVNADGTLLAGSYAGPEKRAIYEKFPNKGDYFERIHAAFIEHTLFTIEVKTGKLNKIHTEKAWLNHVQFSPTDPNILMYSHEGPWHLVDRIWTIDVNTGKNQLMHPRTMDMEIAGHEFFGPDGRFIWYDLQLPKGETFYLAGLDLSTGETRRYAMNRNEWSIHFNISRDKKHFAGDGGDSTQVAHAPDGRWIYLFEPAGDSLKSKKLVNMKSHGYRPLEPNVHFSPDGKFVIFRSDLDGELHIYAVEL